MRVALMALLMIPLALGCISAKTTFRDFSDLSDTPYTYVKKNASFTHTTALSTPAKTLTGSHPHSW